MAFSKYPLTGWSIIKDRLMTIQVEAEEAGDLESDV
jgi:hypothetical protein